MTPRLSVVVPYHNVGDYIGQCLASLAHQTLTDLEVILVDDGSTDHSRDVAQQYVVADSRFVVVTQENEGLGSARNTGAQLSQGEFLTFVDSDDLVPWDAYELMVEALEETGSSFAAGNARRFSRSRGVWQSWAHQREFATTILATDILERPGLAFDRMIWNKVFRRDFYQAQGYEFPPIRYEDYPVSLRAHLDAVTVDVLADPCYFWRDRESSNSITQQGFQYDNLLDRVHSAEMVLDVAERAASPIRAAVQQHLAQIDLVLLAQAFEVVSDEHVGELLALGHRLFDRLDVAVLAQRPPFEQVQHAALRALDVGLLRRLGRYRSRTDPSDARARRSRSRPWMLEADYPRGRESQVSRSLYRLPRSEIQPITEVHDVRLRSGVLTIRGTARLRHLDADERDELGLELVRRAGPIPVPLSGLVLGRTDGGRRCWEFQGEVDISKLGDIPSAAWPLPFAISYRHGLWHRRALLRGVKAGSPTLPDGLWAKPDVWVQWTQTSGGALAMARITRPVVLNGIEIGPDAFTLTLHSPEHLEQGWIEIAHGNRRRMAGRVRATATHGNQGSELTARLPVAEIVSEQVPKDPYHLTSTVRLQLADENRNRRILWTDRFTSADIPHGEEIVSLRPTPFRWLEAIRGPARSRADAISVSPTDIITQGTWWSQAAPEAVCWRRFLPGSDEHVDVQCMLDIRRGQFLAAAPLRMLAGFHTSALQWPLYDWSLFSRTASGDESVLCSEAVGATLPQTAMVSGQKLRIVMVRDTIHVEVRPNA